MSNWTRLAAVALAGCLLAGCHSSFVLLRKLKSSDASTRRDAAEDLGRKRDPSAVEPLIAALADRDEGVRRAAAKALGQIGDKRAVAPILARFPTEDKYTQQDFADALGALKDARAMPALFAALKTQDEFGKKHMSDALAAIGPAAIPTVLANLRDPDPGVRKSSAECLVSIAYDISVGNLPGSTMQQLDPALPALAAALQDPVPEVRSAAANALGRIGNPSSIAPMIALFHDANDDVREADASALSGFGAVATEPLLEAMRDNDPNMRIGAARALGSMAWTGHSTQAAEALKEALAKGNLEIAAGAYTYFISQGDPSAMTVLIAAFEKYPERRMANELLNCGNKDLSDAVHAWADKHGATIDEKSGSAGTAKWGSH